MQHELLSVSGSHYQVYNSKKILNKIAKRDNISTIICGQGTGLGNRATLS